MRLRTEVVLGGLEWGGGGQSCRWRWLRVWGCQAHLLNGLDLHTQRPGGSRLVQSALLTWAPSDNLATQSGGGRLPHAQPPVSQPMLRLLPCPTLGLDATVGSSLSLGSPPASSSPVTFYSSSSPSWV